MAANYLHGAETIEIQKGPIKVRVVKSAVIVLIGTAPTGPVQTPTLVQSQEDAAQFGKELPNFTIPQALAAIFAQGYGTVVVINIFTEANHLVAVTAESLVTALAAAKTTHAPIGAVAITNAAGVVTYTEGTEYEIDEFGNITILDVATIPNGTTIKATYDRFDPTSVVNAKLIGAVDVNDNTRTGMKAMALIYNLFGFKPKLILCPTYSTINAIKEQMITEAETYRAFALIDAPSGTIPTDAITGRGPGGAINLFTSSKRAILLMPYLKAYDEATDADQNRPFSQFMAGVIAANDYENGYWSSPSNREIRGITGVEQPITWAINDPTSEANLLNEQGIVTVAMGFGTGTRTWGNRSAAWPSNTKPENFVAVQRTADVVHESLELASLEFIDKPINNALIDSIVASGNAFVRTLVQRGALLPGSEVFYDPARNSASELAAGHAVFSLRQMPPPPLERLTYESNLDISLLSNLGQ